MSSRVIRSSPMSADLILAGVAAVLTYGAVRLDATAALREDTVVLADVMAENCVPALSFENEGDAERILASLSYQPYVIAAARLCPIIEIGGVSFLISTRLRLMSSPRNTNY